MTTESTVKRALREIRELKAQLAKSEASQREPLAVVGIGCRLPGGVTGPESFWELLLEGRDAIGEIPPDRWNSAAFYDGDPDAPGKVSTRFGGFIGDVDTFDPGFFGISPREADSMDPQQRLLLEVSYEALEHAGMAADRLRGSQTGVFVGIGTSDYMQLRTRAEPHDAIDAYYTLGSVSHSVASGRLAYSFGFNGPALSVDTACSSSLVAIHLACNALRRGECSIALAAGVGLILAPDNAISLSKAHMLAPDGRCKTFDARADGFARGEGCGVVVLKRLSDAEADGDNILAVVLGSAMNQDGRSTGLTVPNGPAQESVIRAALKNAGVDPLDVSYVEAHGTGTELGDPIEVQALASALCEGRDRGQALRIGSVKTNVGHLESAAGVTGFIKLVLSLDKATLPAQLHFETPNPHIPWSDLPIDVQSTAEPWAGADGSRIAGVSSFGFSGTNAHIVLGDPPRRVADVSETGTLPKRSQHVLALSAGNEEALTRLCARYQTWFSAERDTAFADECYTTNTGRAQLSERCAIVASSEDEAREVLEARARAEFDQRMHSGSVDVVRPRVAFLFSGQGAQHAGMGRTLYDAEPAFRDAFDRCDAEFQRIKGESLCDVVFDANGAERIDDTTYTQPSLFAFEYALASLWLSWGVKPDCVIGHSLGEYVAACIAGVFSAEDGMRLVVERSRLMGGLTTQGAMAAVFADEGRVRDVLASSNTKVCIAAINGPANTVISGAAEEIDDVLEVFAAQDVSSSRLTVSLAFHSEHLEPMLDSFEAAADGVAYAAPRVPVISNLTGQPMTEASDFSKSYWRRQTRDAVRFQDGVRQAADLADVLLEIGPHTTLAAMAGAALSEAPRVCAASLHRERDDWDQLLETLAKLWAAGVEVDWDQYHASHSRIRVGLPTYPFAQERYWFAETDSPAERWERVIAAGSSEAEAFELDVAAYAEKWALLDRMTAIYTREALAAMGAFAAADGGSTVDDVMQRCGVEPAHRKLMRRWLDALAADGLLAKDGASFVPEAPFAGPTRDELDGIRREADELLHDVAGVRAYLDRSRSILVSVLRGEVSPVESLFPAGSFDIADAIYRDWDISRYFNRIVSAAVAAAIAPTGKPRLLEIGAGTGGTTAMLLDDLSDAIDEYWFTDVSDLFLGVAAERFGHSCMRYALLDIEADPMEQGFNAGGFDIVVASNVLHTATNLDAALDGVRKLLAPGGVLILFESTDEPRWCDATFGLLSGWQRYDRGDEKATPLLSVSEWQVALSESGFERFQAFSPPPEASQLLYQDVFAAQIPVDGPGRADRVRSDEDASSGAGTEGATADAAIGVDLAALPMHERVDTVAGYVRRTVMTILRLDESKTPGLKSRLMDLGFDSLMAVELRSRLEKTFDLHGVLPATLVFDYPTIEAIARHISAELDLSSLDEATDGGAVTAPDSNAAAEKQIVADDLEDLSDEEVAAMLMKKLGAAD